MNAPPSALNITLMAHRPDYANASISAKQIIDAINQAVTHTQRLQALQTAFRAFHHQNEELHNFEIDLGADKALCLKLGYILLQKNADAYMEIEMVCAALQMVYRCSLERRIRSFRDIGYTELIPLVIQVINVKEVQSGTQSHAILKTLLVLRVFTKLEVAKPYLIKLSPLFAALIQLIWSFEKAGGENWIVLEKDVEAVQLEVLGIFKDLTFRTTDEDKATVYAIKGFVPTLLHFGRKTPAVRLRECVSAIWWNLAMSSNVGQDMTNHAEVLTTLHNLINPQDMVKTRRNAISSIGNLSTVPLNHERLLSHQDGLLIHSLLTAARDEDTDSRRRSVRTLRCLCSGPAAHSLRRRADFCALISASARSDLDRDTRVQALECMAYIADDTKAMQEVGSSITTALIGTIENSNHSTLTIEACRALSVSLSKSSEPPATELSTAFYAKLSTAATESSRAESHGHLAKVISSLGQAGGFANKVPPPPLLHLLSTLISKANPFFEQSRNVAMTTVMTLAQVDDGNKRVLAEDEGLLTALVNFAIATKDGVKKDEAKTLILKLVPEL